MMRKLAFILISSAAMLGPAPVMAYEYGTPIITDSRIKTYVYNENDVYRLLTHYGYQLNIEFGPKERIETISVGDRSGWQIIPAGQRLFVRAMEDRAHTNMTVVTSRRAYQFDLEAVEPTKQGYEELVYVVRFFYPDEEPRANMGSLTPAPSYPATAAAGFSPAMPAVAPAPAPGAMPLSPAPEMAPPVSPPASGMMATGYNYNYTFTGSEQLIPNQIFDDGQMTYFQVMPGKLPPEVFRVSQDGKEVPLKLESGNQYLTASGVYSRLVLRGNGTYACVYNEARSGL
jgi:type IV secretion system protein VirB9